MKMDETPKRKMLIEMPIPVHSYDVDYMQIVNNTVYVKWFENLRMAILDKYFPLAEMMKSHNTPILSETIVEYKRSIGLYDKPAGVAWIDELERSRWVARFEISVGGVLYCTGKQTGCYFSLDTRRPTRFPPELLESYAKM